MAPRVTTKDFKLHPALDHPQEVQALFHLVDLFANEMKIRLLTKYHKGKRGWDTDPGSRGGALFRNELKMKLGTRDPVDTANLAMFLWNLR